MLEPKMRESCDCSEYYKHYRIAHRTFPFRGQVPPVRREQGWWQVDTHLLAPTNDKALCYHKSINAWQIGIEVQTTMQDWRILSQTGLVSSI